MKRMLTVRKKKKRNDLEMFGKRSKMKFPTRRHYCGFCNRKRWTIQK
jgi:hypothetical protein